MNSNGRDGGKTLFNIDVDFDFLPGWKLRAIIDYFAMVRLFGVPEIMVSAGRRGLHYHFPAVVSEQDDPKYRDLYDCDGHAHYTKIRKGAQILFYRKNGVPCLESDDIYHALELLEQTRKH